MTPEVTLLAHSPNPTRLMALSARLCYTQGISIKDLNDKLTDEACEKLVLKILSNKHVGVLEHPFFSFGIEGISRDFLQQLARHRHTSLDVQSMHYTICREGYEMAMPANLSDDDRIEWLEVKGKSFALYRKLIDQGMPRETARHIIPGGIETKLIASACLRQWMRFVELRACPVNVPEAITVAHKIKNKLIELMPYLRPHLGPPCIAGNCYEGTRYCGAPWVTPCRITGDGIDQVVNTKEEAMAWTSTK